MYDIKFLSEQVLCNYDDFPGARVLRMPFKEAVEIFIQVKYGERLEKGITLAEIGHEKPKLRQAIKDYKKRFAKAPFDIPSVRDIVHERVVRVLENGFRGTRLDRQATMSMLKRQKIAPT